MRKSSLAIAAAVTLALHFALPAQAQEPSDAAIAFVEGNVLSTFYHELGHALIDVMELPVLGQEEDAADILSVVLTHELWEEDVAQETAWATASSFLFSASEQEDDLSAYADVHGLNLQRYYNHVCLFYGANPDARAEFLTTFELPPERAEGCAEEYTLAADSWGTYLEDIATETPGTSLQFEVDEADSMSILLADEIASLNEIYNLPKAITVELADCGEANAFYAASNRTITMCTEYVDYLFDQAAAQEL